MHREIGFWWRSVFGQRRGPRVRSLPIRARLRVERLEDRTLLSPVSLSGIPIDFTRSSTSLVEVGGSLSSPSQFNLYQVNLNVGDQVTASIKALTAESGLQSLLRVFNSAGQQVALDNQEGGDPALTFQATTAGAYFVGVSSAGNSSYDPDLAGSGTPGDTAGQYTLDLLRTQSAPVLPNLAGESFRLTTDTAAYGAQVTGSFTIGNRGGQDAGSFDVQLVLSPDNQFGSSSLVLQTFHLSGGLAAGQEFESGPFTVTLPTLSALATAGFPISATAYLGLRIDPTHSVPESNPFDQSGVHRGEDYETLTLLTPITASGTNHSQANADYIGDLNTQVSGAATSGQTDWYQVEVASSERLTASVTATAGSSLFPQLTLAGPDGEVLAQADNGSIVQYLQPGVYFLTVSGLSGQGGYQLNTAFVQASQPLAAALPVGVNPRNVLVADLTGSGNLDLIVANTGSNTLSVLLGNGDGTFQDQRTISLAADPAAVAVADLTGNGKQDLIVADSTGTVSVLLGNGDGSFGTPQVIATGLSATALAVADLRGNGKQDLVVTGSNGTVSVLLGSGNGTFGTPQTVATGASPGDLVSVLTADVNGDSIPDLIVADDTSNTLSELLGNGDGSFGSPRTILTGISVISMVSADLTGNGKQDLVLATSTSAITVLLGNGDGTWQSPLVSQVIPVSQLAVADLNRTGPPDLVVSDYTSGTLYVLAGNGDGTFGPPQPCTLTGVATSLAVADFSGDGNLDIVASENVIGAPGVVGVLLGRGDGALQAQPAFAVDPHPSLPAVADLTGNGKLDIVVGTASGQGNVLLGNGDGTFQPALFFPTGQLAGAILPADLNGDGKPDLVVNFLTYLGVLLGNGDGTFQPMQIIAQGLFTGPATLADLTGNGKEDIVGTTANGVAVLLGNGDGTFQAPRIFPTGIVGATVKVADLTGNGKLDLIVTDGNVGSGQTPAVVVLLGNGDGTFGPPQIVLAGAPSGSGPGGGPPAGPGGGPPPGQGGPGPGPPTPPGGGPPGGGPPVPYSISPVVVADLTGNGKEDLVIPNLNGNTVSVLLGNGDGTFQPPQTVYSVPGPTAQTLFVVAADLTGDGKEDLVVADSMNDVTVLLNNSAPGTDAVSFAPPQTFSIGATSWSPLADGVVATDLNGDGKMDLVVSNFGVSSLTVLLGRGDGTFVPSTPDSGALIQNTPYQADLTGNGLPDTVILNDTGTILFRQGLPATQTSTPGGGQGQAFAPPVSLDNKVVYNQAQTSAIVAAGDQSLLPGYQINAEGELEGPVSARDLTVLNTPTGQAVATADTTPNLYLLATQHQYVYSVTLYRYSDGGFQRSTAFTTSFLPTRIVAGDLTGNGLDDLVVANSLNDSIQVAFQNPDGSFRAPITLATGVTPSDISLLKVNGDRLLDIVVTNQVSGDVSVFLNDSSHSFTTVETFRGGLGPFGTDTSFGIAQSSSLNQSISLAAGDFTGQGRSDLVVVNRGSDSFSVLVNNGQGGFANPQLDLTTSTNDASLSNNQPGPAVAGYFHGTSQPLDLAILMESIGQVWIYTGDGQGHFSHTFSIQVGTQATGLSVVAGSTPGLFNLLVGDEFGDVLLLQGKGDGTFQAPGNRVSLAVQPDLLGQGQAGVLVANQQTNQVTLQTATAAGNQFAPVQTLAASTPITQFAPGNIYWVLLDKNSTLPDAVVVGSGSNDILIYRTLAITNGVPVFATNPQTLFVGTDPVSITFADINGDRIPDLLVANNGSNDISTFFGSYDSNGNWVGIAGPRLQSGGAGPVAVNVVADSGSPGGLDLAVTNGDSGNVAVLPGRGQGFFDDRTPTVSSILPPTSTGVPLTVVGPPLFFGNQVVMTTSEGTVVAYNPSDPSATAITLFAPPDGQSVEAIDAITTGTLAGDLVAALTGGTVDLLQSTAGGTFEPVTGLAFQNVSNNGTPLDPSDVVVLDTATGLQVLVSNRGVDTLFVFALQVSQASSLALPSASTNSVVELNPFNNSEAALGPSSLTLIATLLAPAITTEELAATQLASAAASKAALGANGDGDDSDDNQAGATGPGSRSGSLNDPPQDFGVPDAPLNNPNLYRETNPSQDLFQGSVGGAAPVGSGVAVGSVVPVGALRDPRLGYATPPGLVDAPLSPNRGAVAYPSRGSRSAPTGTTDPTATPGLTETPSPIEPADAVFLLPDWEWALARTCLAAAALMPLFGFSLWDVGPDRCRNKGSVNETS